MPGGASVTPTALSDTLAVGLMVLTAGWIAFSVRQIQTFPSNARGWMNARAQVQLKRQQSVFQQVLTMAFPDLILLYFRLPSQPTPLEAPALRSAASRMLKEPEDADYTAQKALIEPIVKATIKDMFERLPQVLPKLLLLPDVSIGLLNLPCYAEDEEKNRSRINWIVRRYAFAVCVAALLLVLELAAAKTDLDLRRPSVITVLAAIHAAHLEFIRYRLTRDLEVEVLATEGGVD